MKFLKIFKPTAEFFGDKIPEGTRLTEQEWWDKRITNRVYVPCAPCDLRDPRNVIDWAMGVRRPGEGAAAPEAHVDHDAAAYIAECVTVAENLKFANSRDYKNILSETRSRRDLSNIVTSLRTFASEIEKKIK